MADNVITVPTQKLSRPYIGPGLPHNTTSAPSGGQQTLLTADTNPDELGQLQPLALKQDSFDPGVQFPGLMMREEQTKSLAVHMYPNLDSGRVENMGRNPATFHVRGIFTNNIFPGGTENWTPGLLWPNTFIAIYNILLANTDIIFQHPFLGDITVQVHSWTYELNPKQARDGALLDIQLIETIGQQNNPLSQAIVGPKGSGMALAANTLDTAIAAAPQSTSLPGLSLSQMFGQVANLINQAESIPNNIVNAIATPIQQTINGFTSLGADLINAPAYIVQNTNAQIQATKNSVLNSPLQTAAAGFQGTFGVPLTFNNFIAASSLPFYTPSTFQAMQSILSLNNTPSQSAFQLMDKLMRALVDLRQHYIDQNNINCAPVIEAIVELLLQTQQEQSALSLNTANQSVSVATYVTTGVLTWMQLSTILNNPVDDLMALNQGQINGLSVPSNSTINYYQS